MVEFKTSLAESMIENLGENALVKYWSKKNNELDIDPFEIGKGSSKKVWFVCQDVDYHPDYDMSANSFTQGSRCPYCRGFRVCYEDSFAQWMLDNLGDGSLEGYWSKKNDNLGINPWEISKLSTTKVWIICQEKEYHENYNIKPYDFTKRNHRCLCCRGLKVHPKDSFAQWGIDNICVDFLDKYWSDKNTISPWEITSGSCKDIWIKCDKTEYHEDYKTEPRRFANSGCRCPYCCNSHGKVHMLDSLGALHPKSITSWSGKNKKSPYEYAPKSRSIVYWKCENGIHKDYERSIGSSSDYNFNCPECANEREESYLQEKVRLLLTDELNYKVNHEHNCELKCINPKTNHPLPYDNEVLINNKRLIIEVHGQQHYYICTWTKERAKNKDITPQEELWYIQWKDEYKKQYAQSKGYFYLAIPYRTDNEQEEWRTLIENKINEINQ